MIWLIWRWDEKEWDAPYEDWKLKYCLCIPWVLQTGVLQTLGRSNLTVWHGCECMPFSLQHCLVSRGEWAWHSKAPSVTEKVCGSTHRWQNFISNNSKSSALSHSDSALSTTWMHFTDALYMTKCTSLTSSWAEVNQQSLQTSVKPSSLLCKNSWFMTGWQGLMKAITQNYQPWINRTA